jgi:hypothetical protein
MESMRFFAPDLMHNRKNTTTNTIVMLLVLYLVACREGFPPDWSLESTFLI